MNLSNIEYSFLFNHMQKILSKLPEGILIILESFDKSTFFVHCKTCLSVKRWAFYDDL